MSSCLIPLHGDNFFHFCVIYCCLTFWLLAVCEWVGVMKPLDRTPASSSVPLSVPAGVEAMCALTANEEGHQQKSMCCCKNSQGREETAVVKHFNISQRKVITVMVLMPAK